MAKIDKISIQHGLQGATFGVTEAIIMMMGVLYALIVTDDRKIILLGLLASGIADAFANASAFHISEEAEKIHSRKEVWKSTILCFFGTAVPVFLFILPVILFPVYYAAIIDGFVGLLILAGIGYFVGRVHAKHKSFFVIFEYLALGIIIPVICYLAGRLVYFFTS